MTESVIVGGHRRIRPFNTADTYPEQHISNDLCQAVVAGHTVYLRGQVAQDLETRESVAIGNPAGQARKVMDNIALLLGEAGAQLDHIVTCDIYLTDIRAEHLLHLKMSGWRTGEEHPARLKYRLPPDVAGPVGCRAGGLEHAVVGDQFTQGVEVPAVERLVEPLDDVASLVIHQ